jgi:protein arginine N-methyltransferase 1
VPERSLDVAEPPRVDVVVAEVLGNFAYEEDVLETLRDAQRFLRPGGTLIPASITQWVAPVTTDRFERDLCTWRDVGFGLDWSDAERMTRNNMYVLAIEPNDLLENASASWDSLDFAGPMASRRAGRAAWRLQKKQEVFGLALWWECTLAPGIVLSTSPYAPQTHWDQIYLPLLTPIVTEPGDEIALSIESETGGAESGIEVRWGFRHERGGRAVSDQNLSIAAGYLG